MTSNTRTRKKTTKKKVTKKDNNSGVLNNIKFKIKGVTDAEFKRNVTIVDKDNRIDEVPYYIPFRNASLNMIMGGGIIGGTQCEIAAESQGGKSYLAYELISECQKMGGFANLNDGERAFDESYAQISEIDLESGTFAHTTFQDMNTIFSYWRQFIEGIRATAGCKHVPILLVQDSFPTMITSDALEHANKGEEMGYESVRKNLAYSKQMEKFTGFLKQHKATLLVINQFTRNLTAGMYENPYQSLCEQKIQYYSTQRLKGMLGPKLVKSIKIDGKEEKITTGRITRWETIKNRKVKPFQKIAVKIRYDDGIDELSGLIELLLKTERLFSGTSKEVYGESHDKAVDVLRLSPKYDPEQNYKIRYDKKNKDAYYREDVYELIEKFPEIVVPIVTGTYDSGENLYNDKPDREDSDVKQNENCMD